MSLRRLSPGEEQGSFLPRAARTRSNKSGLASNERKARENSGLWLEQWLTHQKRDDYWRHGSVCEDYAAVRCPVMAVSGWADGYTNSVFRMLEHLDVPRQGLIGPWSHKYPHQGMPGPAIDFQNVAVRWWDR